MVSGYLGDFCEQFCGGVGGELGCVEGSLFQAAEGFGNLLRGDASDIIQRFA